jgi:5-methylthioribose kinase
MYIDIETTRDEIKNFLKELNFLETNETITGVETPGEGNMNVVLRVQTNKRSVIVKQSRPFVQKYQDIAAPLDRITVEHQFYSAVADSKIAQHIPKVLGFYDTSHTLILEDLGHCRDMSYLYDSRLVEEAQLKTLVTALETIHSTSVANTYPDNITLRELNHQHIFVLPFLLDNGFSLDNIQEGLEKVSLPYKKDGTLKDRINLVGQKYLDKGNTLIHGDYYPGSWMTKGNQIFIIDPEFSFMGFAEFDVGVLAAHCIMITMDGSILEQIMTFYKSNLNVELLRQIAGIEIMRRIIGLAQLPVKRSLDEKKHLLELAYRLVMQ